MDPRPADDSRRRAPIRGGKSCGGKQLGFKRSSAPSPSPPLGFSAAAPSTPAPNPSTRESNPSPAAPTSSAAAPTSTMPPWKSQGAGWGAIPSNLASPYGNQQGPNCNHSSSESPFGISTYGKGKLRLNSQRCSSNDGKGKGKLRLNCSWQGQVVWGLRVNEELGVLQRRNYPPHGRIGGSAQPTRA